MDPKEIRKRRARKLQGRRTGVARAIVNLIDIYVSRGSVSVHGVEELRKRAEEFERLDDLTCEAERHARDIDRTPHLA